MMVVVDDGGGNDLNSMTLFSCSFLLMCVICLMKTKLQGTSPFEAAGASNLNVAGEEGPIVV